VPREKKKKPVSDQDLDAVRAAIREWANAEKRNGSQSIDLPDIVEMLVATGMRIGELLALRWSDVELTAPIERHGDENWFPWLMVNGQITSKGKRVGYGKTDAAIRPIALPDWAAALLRRRKVAQTPHDLDEVFVTRNGTWHHPTRAVCATSDCSMTTPTSRSCRAARPTPSDGRWRPRSTRSTTPRPP
jgi:integrase